MRALTLTALLLLCGSGLIACGTGTDDGTASAPPGGSHRGRRPSEPELRARFAVLRAPRHAPLPADLLPPTAVRRLALNLGGARLARGDGDRRVYVVPGPRVVCLVSKGPTSNCWPLATVLAGRAIATSICGPGQPADEIVTFGLVPDGVREVMIGVARRAAAAVPPRGNVFIARGSSNPPLPQHLAWRIDGRWERRSTGIPPEVARRGCGRASGYAPVAH